MTGRLPLPKYPPGTETDKWRCPIEEDRAVQTPSCQRVRGRVYSYRKPTSTGPCCSRSFRARFARTLASRLTRRHAASQAGPAVRVRQGWKELYGSLNTWRVEVGADTPTHRLVVLSRRVTDWLDRDHTMRQYGPQYWHSRGLLRTRNKPATTEGAPSPQPPPAQGRLQRLYSLAITLIGHLHTVPFQRAASASIGPRG